MLFNSITFMLFFVVVLGLHSLPLPWKFKKFNLLIASYIFYGAWSPPFVLLLMGTTLLDWLIARWMGQTEAPTRRRWLLLFSLLSNFGILGYFKYGGFLLENFTTAVNAVGIPYAPAAPNIVLPVGISFYTFQTLSYTIDVYRGHLKPARSLLDFALFVTFFPQLVAGPIVRAIDFLPQLDEPKQGNAKQLSWGLSLLVLGLWEKVVVADALLAPIADKAFAEAAHLPAAHAWAGTLAFSGQIFCDFAGYSTCAIGVGLCFGFALQDNFHFPYAALGFSDFWRRWHISLSSWLRDYLYISIGGNRHGELRTYINLMITMLLGGLWHGASWTFVVWGGLHGLYLAVERMLKNRFGGSNWLKALPVKLLLILLTYVAICFTWVFFRAPDFPTASDMITAMLFWTPGPRWSDIKSTEVVMVGAITAAMLSLHILMRDTYVEHVAQRTPWWLRGALLGGMLAMIVTMAGDDRAFIYFQF